MPGAKPINYSPHYLFSFGGTLAEGEIWECGVRCFPTNDQAVKPDPINGVQFTDQLGQLADWWRDPQNGCSSTAKLSWFKFNAIGADGRYMNKSHTNVIDFPPIPGPKDPVVGSFLSVAITWTTARTRPPGAAGRVYLPNFGVAPESLDPLVVAKPQQDGLIVAGKSLLDVVRYVQILADVPGGQIGSISYVPCVASSVDASLNIITGVSVGRRYDSQRRRHNAIDEVPRVQGYDWQHKP